MGCFRISPADTELRTGTGDPCTGRAGHGQKGQRRPSQGAQDASASPRREFERFNEQTAFGRVSSGHEMFFRVNPRRGCFTATIIRRLDVGFTLDTPALGASRVRFCRIKRQPLSRQWSIATNQRGLHRRCITSFVLAKARRNVNAACTKFDTHDNNMGRQHQRTAKPAVIHLLDSTA